MTTYNLHTVRGGNNRLFASLDAMARWLNNEATGVFCHINQDGTETEYARVTPDLLARLLEERPGGLAPTLHVDCGWADLVMMQQFVWSKIDVIE